VTKRLTPRYREGPPLDDRDLAPAFKLLGDLAVEMRRLEEGAAEEKLEKAASGLNELADDWGTWIAIM
jgi:hypothetical protein